MPRIVAAFTVGAFIGCVLCAAEYTLFLMFRKYLHASSSRVLWPLSTIALAFGAMYLSRLATVQLRLTVHGDLQIICLVWSIMLIGLVLIISIRSQ